MDDPALTLGGVVFQDAEVPDQISFGGKHAAKAHKLVGGLRVVDAMGRDDIPLEWAGRFFGSDALDRAQSIDAMRKAGVSVSLTWSTLAYTVLITSFVAEYRADFYVPYTIICEIITDDADPSGDADDDDDYDIDDAVSSDMDTASDLGDDIGDDDITSGLSDLQSAVSSVSSFVTATRAEINSVVAPLTSLQATVAGVASNLEGQVLGVAGGSVAGMLGGGSNLAATLLNQVSVNQQLPNVGALSNVLGRMSKNLTSAGTSGAAVIQGAGTLYQLAETAYGDSTAWTDIAAANGLTDPILSGVNAIIIPPSQTGTDGVFEP